MSEDDDPDAPEEDIVEVDYDVLDRIGTRLDGSERFAEVSIRPSYAPDLVVAEYSMGYFPAAVERAYLRIRWFENDDFNIHYSEQYNDGDRWECRWDRHPNLHNTRDHFHPPPDAATPGVDESHPTDWRDVLTEVLRALDERVQAFWE
jgi:hypothetical protein